MKLHFGTTTNGTPRLPLYDAAITYRTPSGRRVRFHRVLAADTLANCEKELRLCLHNENRFGRRRVASVVGEFTATFVAHQS